MSFSDALTMMAREVLQAADDAGVKIATAESCTGGLVSAILTDIPGASDVFERGYVTYSNEAKIESLGVAKALIQDNGAVSERVARAMAEGALRESRADLAVSITGVAGPGGSGVKPEGMVCFALAKTGNETKTVTVEFGPLGRSKVRDASAHYAFSMILDAL